MTRSTDGGEDVHTQVAVEGSREEVKANPTPGTETADGARTRLQNWLDDFDRENNDDIDAEDFNIGQDELIEVRADDLRTVLDALTSKDEENAEISESLNYWRASAVRQLKRRNEMEDRLTFLLAVMAACAERHEIAAAIEWKRAQAAEAEVEGLRRALEPFARVFEDRPDIIDKHPDYDRENLWESACAMGLTYGDLREARAALSSRGQEGKDQGSSVAESGGSPPAAAKSDSEGDL